MARLFATTDSSVSERESRNMERARKIAAQGMVLLENNGVLPLTEGPKRIALYGNGARNTVKGGTGSGDVNSRTVVNVEQGLEAAGYTVATKGWMDRFDRAVEDARAAYYEEIKKAVAAEGEAAIMKLFTDPFQEPPIVPVTDEDIQNSDTDTAVYVLARNSGEGKDRAVEAGDYLLSEEEKTAIKKVTGSYTHTIVVLNVGGVIDTKFLREESGADAVLLMSQAGNIGGYALVDVLTGAVTPSGHLATTWAEDYSDYPNADSFGRRNGDVDDEFYEEGIYVGYRYFDTFGVAPAYPFGYGKSYTDFSIETSSVSLKGNEVEIQAVVTNTGSTYSGKEVVQVYYSAPKGSLEKPYQELAGYAKTGELKPGEQQTVTITYPVESMASYEEATASWVLEPGSYYVRVGNSSRNTHVAAALILDQKTVTEKLSNRLAPDCGLTLLSAADAVPYSYPQEKEEQESCVKLNLLAEALLCKTAVYREKNEVIQGSGKQEAVTMNDVLEGKAALDELVSQLTVEEMANLCVGTARGGFGGTVVIGSASALCPGAAGDTTSDMIESRNIRNMVLADGPAGLRLSKTFKADKDGNLLEDVGALPGMEYIMPDAAKPAIPEDAVTYYQYCTAIPIATLLAQTWDVHVIEEAGDIVGEEMEELGVTLWLAPGMNIHRNPLCGRNFEYYSEDPLISGLCAAADTNGVQKHRGIGTTIKHFAFNNQEDNRMHTNAHVAERTAREIYLKGFEIAVKTSQPMSIMTSYNLLNGIHTANNYDLLTAIARDEWGFEGLIMTDWGTTGGIEMNPGVTFKYGCSTASGCIMAGNDLTMPGSQADIDDIIASVGNTITLGDLQACAKRILNILMQSSAYAGAKPYHDIMK